MPNSSPTARDDVLDFIAAIPLRMQLLTRDFFANRRAISAQTKRTSFSSNFFLPSAHGSFHINSYIFFFVNFSDIGGQRASSSVSANLFIGPASKISSANSSSARSIPDAVLSWDLPFFIQIHDEKWHAILMKCHKVLRKTYVDHSKSN